MKSSTINLLLFITTRGEKRMKKIIVSSLCAVSMLGASIAIHVDKASAMGRELILEVPLGLPDLPIPEDNPMTMEKVELGKMLYFDPRLSIDGSISCATCHDPSLGYSNAASKAAGVNHAIGGANTPTILNVAYSKLQFWDGREPTLEAQAGGPMTAPVEMAGIPDEIAQKLNKVPEYRALSMAAFGEYLSFENVAKAIATFERTILAGNSPFDKFYYGGEKDAISESAKRGKKIFDDPEKGNCKKCHTYNKTDGYFSDNMFHNVGLGMDKDKPDVGRYGVTKNKEDMGRQKTPTLRNAAVTAPYFHDGSTYSLREACQTCLTGIPNKNLDPEYKAKRKLSDKEMDDLIEFMAALDGELPIFAIPAIPGL
jgi:cytochrome c peroxidase